MWTKRQQPAMERQPPRVRGPAAGLAAFLLALGLGAWAFAAPDEGLNEGLVTALDRIGGNLLGDAVWNAVATPVPEDGSPQALRLFVAAGPPNPVELILQDPPDPVVPQAPFFRATVGTDGSLTLEFDSLAAGGREFPKVVPADLSAAGQPVPDDGEPQAGSFNDGLVIALDKIGGNLLGEEVWDAGTVGEIVPCIRVRLATNSPNPVELILQNPPEPVVPQTPFFRATVGTDGNLTLEFDVVAAGGGTDFPEVLEADLSGADPTEPGDPTEPD